MKTLKEGVNDVMSGAKSKNAKAAELAKLGITKYEVGVIMRMWRPAATPLRTFGVEIECYNVRRADLTSDSKLLAALRGLGSGIESQAYNHSDAQSVYRIVNDASIVGNDGQEVVSPVLTKNTMKGLKAVCDALNRAGAKVNRTTGLHVHVGTDGLTQRQMVDIVRNYQALEPAIDTFMPASRRGNENSYCRGTMGCDYGWCNTIEDVMAEHGNSRYYKVNAKAYLRHRTIEFRQHGGTTDFAKISSWINFLNKLVDYSRNAGVIPTCIYRIEDIPFLTEEEKQYFISRRTALQ